METAALRARAPALLCALALAALVAAGTWLRISIAHAQPIWDSASPVGLLKSDPALLYWFTERIAENGGALPDEFAASTAVQWPDAVDARVEFPQLQMWLAANSWRWSGGGVALHEWCTRFFALLASLALLGTYGIAREATGSRLAGLLAAAAAFLLPATWRTASFVLLGEDVALPMLALHLWAAARAARRPSRAAFLLAGLPLAVAMAAWHATGFFVAMEAGALLLWCLRSGSNPFAARGAWLALLPFALACVFEPMLRGKLQIVSLPMQVAGALLVLAAIERRRALAPWTRAGVALALLAALAGAAFALGRLAGGGIGDYSHVFRLIGHKLLHLGRLPADPGALPFEVRILWQGPFETAQLRALLLNLSAPLFFALAAAAAAVPGWRRGAGDGIAAVAAPMVLASLLASWLIFRSLAFAALLFPAAGAWLVVAAARRVPEAGRSLAALGLSLVLLVPPLAKFGEFVRYVETKNPWYDAAHAAEIRGAVAAVERLVPRDAAVAGDEVNSTAILAHTGRPIVVQPKYESSAARARLEEYRMAATRGTPAELAGFLRRHRCRWLLLDWHLLWQTRYQAGLRNDATSMDGDTALALAYQGKELPGFRMVWRSGGRRDGMRLYELVER